jgi:hypothetical protein
MKLVPFTNNTINTLHIGSATIPAGETRDVDESLLPGYGQETIVTEAELPSNPMIEMLKSNVRSVLEKIAALSDADLAQLVAQEEAGANRKTIIEAVGAEILRRAAGGSSPDAANAETEAKADADAADAAAALAAGIANDKAGE